MVDLPKIKALRVKLGMSQQQAAEKASLNSRQQWYQLESGRKVPTLETLGKVAAALGVKAKDLLR